MNLGMGKGSGTGSGAGTEEGKKTENKRDIKGKKRSDGCSAEMGVLVEFDDNKLAKNAGAFIDKSEWLTTKEAAFYLRKVSSLGDPSENAIHKMIARGAIRRRKFAGRLFFRKKELDFLIESSVV